MTDLKALSEAATQGRWCQFHPDYCPEAKGTDFREFDTSHDMSAVLPDGSRYKLGHYRHARDANLAECLVNAYRNGSLVDHATHEAALARVRAEALEEAAKVAEDFADKQICAKCGHARSSHPYRHPFQPQIGQPTNVAAAIRALNSGEG